MTRYPRVLTAAAHSFLDAAFLDEQGREVYRSRTNPTSRQTFLSSSHDGTFATVQWPAPSTFTSTDPVVTVDGVRIPASEMLVSTYIHGSWVAVFFSGRSWHSDHTVVHSSRKFRVPGYSDNFKLKKASASMWQVNICPCYAGGSGCSYRLGSASLPTTTWWRISNCQVLAFALNSSVLHSPHCSSFPGLLPLHHQNRRSWTL